MLTQYLAPLLPPPLTKNKTFPTFLFSSLFISRVLQITKLKELKFSVQQHQNADFSTTLGNPPPQGSCTHKYVQVIKTYSLFLSLRLPPFLTSSSTTCLRLGKGEAAAQCYIKINSECSLAENHAVNINSMQYWQSLLTMHSTSRGQRIRGNKSSTRRGKKKKKSSSLLISIWRNCVIIKYDSRRANQRQSHC